METPNPAPAESLGRLLEKADELARGVIGTPLTPRKHRRQLVKDAEQFLRESWIVEAREAGVL